MTAFETHHLHSQPVHSLSGPNIFIVVAERVCFATYFGIKVARGPTSGHIWIIVQNSIQLSLKMLYIFAANVPDTLWE